MLFNNYQKAALTGLAMGYATQAYAQYKLNKAVKGLMEVNEGLADSANRSAYVVMYLVTKLAENGWELDEFDMAVISNPPKAFDPELPNMFSEFFSRFSDKNEITNEDIEGLLDRLKAAREGSDDEA